METMKYSEETLKNLESRKPLQIGDWTASCTGKTFKLNNHGIKLVARDDEGLEKIIFDTIEKNSISHHKKPDIIYKCPKDCGFMQFNRIF